jgi:hypothetical protein
VVLNFLSVHGVFLPGLWAPGPHSGKKIPTGLPKSSQNIDRFMDFRVVPRCHSIPRLLSGAFETPEELQQNSWPGTLEIVPRLGPVLFRTGTQVREANVGACVDRSEFNDDPGALLPTFPSHNHS